MLCNSCIFDGYCINCRESCEDEGPEDETNSGETSTSDMRFSDARASVALNAEALVDAANVGGSGSISIPSTIAGGLGLGLALGA